MPLTGGGGPGQEPGLGRLLYGEVQCIMDNDHMGTPPPVLTPGGY